jgi:hypothetical protein
MSRLAFEILSRKDTPLRTSGQMSPSNQRHSMLRKHTIFLVVGGDSEAIEDAIRLRKPIVIVDMTYTQKYMFIIEGVYS